MIALVPARVPLAGRAPPLAPNMQRTSNGSHKNSAKHSVLNAFWRRNRPTSSRLQLRGSAPRQARPNEGWQLRETDPLLKPPIGTAVIVGAGAAGLISALGLAKFGMMVHVRERVFEQNIHARGQCNAALLPRRFLIGAKLGMMTIHRYRGSSCQRRACLRFVVLGAA
jgi:FAD binding domain